MSSSRDEPPPLSDSQSKIMLRLAKELRRLIVLFDDVLVEEFCKDHKKMPHITGSATPSASSSESSEGSMSPAQGRITCDFCDADVFQSFFECRNCVATSAVDAMDTGAAPEACEDGLVICPSCYAEGRTCRCEVMRPMQCRPFGDLVYDRNWALKVLEQSKVEKVQNHKHTVLTEEYVGVRLSWLTQLMNYSQLEISCQDGSVFSKQPMPYINTNKASCKYEIAR
jgi:hypothetical protein